MEEKLTKKLFGKFVLATKVLPMIIAAIHFLNSTISFFYGNDILLNYIGGISLLSVAYLYLASYVLKLCEYYRLFLHYIVVNNILNIYDVYFGVPVTDVEYYIITVILTIITLFIVLYLKFFK